METAQRDAMFLFHLCMNSNKNLLEERKANWLHLVLLSVLSPAKPRERPLFGRRPWDEAVSAFLLDVYANVGAVDYVAKRYFAGRSPLLPQCAEDLRDLREHAERLVELYNDWLVELGPDGELRPKAGLGAPIDCRAVRQRAAEQATGIVGQTVRLAKAETLVDLGQRRAAADLVSARW